MEFIVVKPPLKKGSPDDFQTPLEALMPLIPYINKNWIIWEPASGEGRIVDIFNKYGWKVISSDILNGKDFLIYEPKHYDVIITNPPYSLKQEFLDRAYKLGKPFAFLLPLTTFETEKRQSLFRKYGIQVIFMPKRINFYIPIKKCQSPSWFATAWFTWGLKLPSDMVWYKGAPEEVRRE